MPSRKNTYPDVFKRGSTWTFKLSYRDSQGAWKQLWRGGFPTQRAAHEARISEEVERNKGIDIAPSKLTVAAWLKRWLDMVAADLKPKTLRGYRTCLEVHIIPVLGSRLLRDLKPAEVRDCYAAIIQAGRSGKTALNVHRVFREALQEAVKLEVIGRNVCDVVTAPKAPKHEVVPPTLEELDRVTAEADKTQYGRVVRFALLTAMRQGEILRLLWRDVDLEKATVTIHGAKHGSNGTIALSADALDLLRAQRQALREQALLVGPAYTQSGLVFPNSIGKPQDVGGLERTWSKIQKRAGVTMRFHDLRHAHASLLIAEGAHAKAIQERLRHRDVSTTLNIYGHLMPGVAADVAAKIDVALRRPRRA